jgi:hypothetical protein
VFEFKVAEILGDRTVVGQLVTTGLRPAFGDKFERRGVEMPETAGGNGRVRDFPAHQLP